MVGNYRHKHRSSQHNPARQNNVKKLFEKYAINFSCIDGHLYSLRCRYIVIMYPTLIQWSAYHERSVLEKTFGDETAIKFMGNGSSAIYSFLLSIKMSLKGTQDWDFFWLRFWNLYYFFISYVKILRFDNKIYLIRPLLGEIQFFRLVWD